MAIFCLTLIHLVLPFMSLFILLRNKDSLHNELFKYSFGELYENTKYNSKVSFEYTSVFILRRFIYLTLGIFVFN